MENIDDSLVILAIGAPVIFFIIGVVFRLLDNSSSIFLKNEILVDSSYVSKDIVKEHIQRTNDESLKKALKKAMVFRKLHNLFMVLMVISIPPVIVMLFYLF